MAGSPPTGHSHYINGPAGLAHLHRLRALVDAVVIGVGTALADDPQLTVRRVSGPQPARVVIDPPGGCRRARAVRADGVRRLWSTGTRRRPPLPPISRSSTCRAADGQIAPGRDPCGAAERGLRAC
jgi:riboflavin biosynthesis pyrimidine reductase